MEINFDFILGLLNAFMGLYRGFVKASSNENDPVTVARMSLRR